MESVGSLLSRREWTVHVLGFDWDERPNYKVILLNHDIITNSDMSKVDFSHKTNQLSQLSHLPISPRYPDIHEERMSDIYRRNGCCI